MFFFVILQNSRNVHRFVKPRTRVTIVKKKIFRKKSIYHLDTLIYVAINYIVVLYWISFSIISMQLSRKLRKEQQYN